MAAPDEGGFADSLDDAPSAMKASENSMLKPPKKSLFGTPQIFQQSRGGLKPTNNASKLTATKSAPRPKSPPRSIKQYDAPPPAMGSMVSIRPDFASHDDHALAIPPIVPAASHTIINGPAPNLHELQAAKPRSKFKTVTKSKTRIVNGERVTETTTVVVEEPANAKGWGGKIFKKLGGSSKATKTATTSTTPLPAISERETQTNTHVPQLASNSTTGNSKKPTKRVLVRKVKKPHSSGAKTQVEAPVVPTVVPPTETVPVSIPPSIPDAIPPIESSLPASVPPPVPMQISMPEQNGDLPPRVQRLLQHPSENEKNIHNKEFSATQVEAVPTFATSYGNQAPPPISSVARTPWANGTPTNASSVVVNQAPPPISSVARSPWANGTPAMSSPVASGPDAAATVSPNQAQQTDHPAVPNPPAPESVSLATQQPAIVEKLPPPISQVTSVPIVNETPGAASSVPAEQDFPEDKTMPPSAAGLVEMAMAPLPTPPVPSTGAGSVVLESTQRRQKPTLGSPEVAPPVVVEQTLGEEKSMSASADELIEAAMASTSSPPVVRAPTAYATVSEPAPLHQSVQGNHAKVELPQPMPVSQAKPAPMANAPAPVAIASAPMPLPSSPSPVSISSEPLPLQMPIVPAPVSMSRGLAPVPTPTPLPLTSVAPAPAPTLVPLPATSSPDIAPTPGPVPLTSAPSPVILQDQTTSLSNTKYEMTQAPQAKVAPSTQSVPQVGETSVAPETPETISPTSLSAPDAQAQTETSNWWDSEDSSMPRQSAVMEALADPSPLDTPQLEQSASLSAPENSSGMVDSAKVALKQQPSTIRIPTAPLSTTIGAPSPTPVPMSIPSSVVSGPAFTAPTVPVNLNSKTTTCGPVAIGAPSPTPLPMPHSSSAAPGPITLATPSSLLEAGGVAPSPTPIKMPQPVLLSAAPEPAQQTKNTPVQFEPPPSTLAPAPIKNPPEESAAAPVVPPEPLVARSPTHPIASAQAAAPSPGPLKSRVSVNIPTLVQDPVDGGSITELSTSELLPASKMTLTSKEFASVEPVPTQTPTIPATPQVSPSPTSKVGTPSPSIQATTVAPTASTPLVEASSPAPAPVTSIPIHVGFHPAPTPGQSFMPVAAAPSPVPLTAEQVAAIATVHAMMPSVPQAITSPNHDAGAIESSTSSHTQAPVAQSVVAPTQPHKVATPFVEAPIPLNPAAQLRALKSVASLEENIVSDGRVATQVPKPWEARGNLKPVRAAPPSVVSPSSVSEGALGNSTVPKPWEARGTLRPVKPVTSEVAASSIPAATIGNASVLKPWEARGSLKPVTATPAPNMASNPSVEQAALGAPKPWEARGTLKPVAPAPAPSAVLSASEEAFGGAPKLLGALESLKPATTAPEPITNVSTSLGSAAVLGDPKPWEARGSLKPVTTAPGDSTASSLSAEAREQAPKFLGALGNLRPVSTAPAPPKVSAASDEVLGSTTKPWEARGSLKPVTSVPENATASSISEETLMGAPKPWEALGTLRPVTVTQETSEKSSSLAKEVSWKAPANLKPVMSAPMPLESTLQNALPPIGQPVVLNLSTPANPSDLISAASSNLAPNVPAPSPAPLPFMAREALKNVEIGAPTVVQSSSEALEWKSGENLKSMCSPLTFSTPNSVDAAHEISTTMPVATDDDPTTVALSATEARVPTVGEPVSLGQLGEPFVPNRTSSSDAFVPDELMNDPAPVPAPETVSWEGRVALTPVSSNTTAQVAVEASESVDRKARASFKSTPAKEGDGISPPQTLDTAVSVVDPDHKNRIVAPPVEQPKAGPTSQSDTASGEQSHPVLISQEHNEDPMSNDDSYYEEIIILPEGANLDDFSIKDDELYEITYWEEESLDDEASYDIVQMDGVEMLG